MAAGYKDFTAGAVLTAADLEDYNQNQSIMRFASAAARDTALSTVKTEGMYAYLIDANTLTVYTGAAWSVTGVVHGTLVVWTPTVTQSGSVTVTVTYAKYQRIGRLITGWFNLLVSGTGSASNAVVIGGLPFTAATSGVTIGYGSLFDNSAAPTGKYPCGVSLDTTTTLGLRVTTAVSGSATDNRLGLVTFTAALAVNDIIEGCFSYEAAAD